MNVMRVYFDDMTWFGGKTLGLRGLCLWSKNWSGRGSLTNTVRGVPGPRLRVNRAATDNVARVACMRVRREVEEEEAMPVVAWGGKVVYGGSGHRPRAEAD